MKIYFFTICVLEQQMEMFSTTYYSDSIDNTKLLVETPVEIDSQNNDLPENVPS